MSDSNVLYLWLTQGKATDPFLKVVEGDGQSIAIRLARKKMLVVTEVTTSIFKKYNGNYIAIK